MKTQYSGGSSRGYWHGSRGQFKRRRYNDGALNCLLYQNRDLNKQMHFNALQLKLNFRQVCCLVFGWCTMCFSRMHHPQTFFVNNFFLVMNHLRIDSARPERPSYYKHRITPLFWLKLFVINVPGYLLALLNTSDGETTALHLRLPLTFHALTDFSQYAWENIIFFTKMELYAFKFVYKLTCDEKWLRAWT